METETSDRSVMDHSDVNLTPLLDGISTLEALPGPKAPPTTWSDTSTNYYSQLAH
jgi:hypothetical protein